jgi:SAM-dependent methyltransferase
LNVPKPGRVASAAERNLAPILQSLHRHAPKQGMALEIASGSGQQIVHFAAAHPGLNWQASDADQSNMDSIAAWLRFAPAENLRPPIVLDAARPGWASEFSGFSLIIMVNLLHLVNVPSAIAILKECSKALLPEGRFMVYGPFLRDGRSTSQGDAEFDAALRSGDPQIGYKDLDWTLSEMAANGVLARREDMPSNNLMLIGQKI